MALEVIDEDGEDEWCAARQSAASELARHTLRGRWVLFKDLTNGKDTYGFRYLYIPRADAQGNTVIDFNRAYNPPCAFTNYATCPLPSARNRLQFRVEAGEKGSAH